MIGGACLRRSLNPTAWPQSSDRVQKHFDRIRFGLTEILGSHRRAARAHAIQRFFDGRAGEDTAQTPVEQRRPAGRGRACVAKACELGLEGILSKRAGSRDFCLDEHVPFDHMLRGIDRYLDINDLRQSLKPFYSPIGRPSVDPELMIRMLIVG
jgi:hypothetical protein